MSTKIEVGLEDILLEALTNAKCKNEVDAKLCYDNAFPLVNKLAEFQSENAENPRKVSSTFKTKLANRLLRSLSSPFGFPS